MGKRTKESFNGQGEYNPKKIIKCDGKCVYCGSTRKLTVDHVIPRSHAALYGEKFTFNNEGNLVAACKTCNSLKGSMDLYEFFDQNPGYEAHFFKHARFVSDQVLQDIEAYLARQERKFRRSKLYRKLKKEQLV